MELFHKLIRKQEMMKKDKNILNAYQEWLIKIFKGKILLDKLRDKLTLKCGLLWIDISKLLERLIFLITNKD